MKLGVNELAHEFDFFTRVCKKLGVNVFCVRMNQFPFILENHL